MRTFSRTWSALALTAALVIGAAACGSDTPAADSEAQVDLTKLDVGKYATEPKDFQPKDRLAVGRFFEAQALASVVPLPMEMDPSLKFNTAGVAHAFLKPDESHPSPMFKQLPKAGFADDATGFVSGFATTGRSEEDDNIGDTMSVSVLLFETEAQASAAATKLGTRGFDRSPEFVSVVKSAKYPNDAFSLSSGTLAGWHATGQFVIVPVVYSEEDNEISVVDPDKLLRLAENAIRVTSERLRAFHPTPIGQIAQRVMDPDGMLSRTLPKADGDSFLDPPGVYDATGDLHFAEIPEQVRERYQRAGIDRTSKGATELVRARNAVAAKQYLVEETADKFMARVDSPQGLSGAYCQKYRGPAKTAIPYYCYVTYGRYVARAWASQLQEAQQRISAQYAILANSK